MDAPPILQCYIDIISLSKAMFILFLSTSLAYLVESLRNKQFNKNKQHFLANKELVWKFQAKFLLLVEDNRLNTRQHWDGGPA